MKFFCIVMFVLIFTGVALCICRFKPKGCDKIYSLVIAHRGLHLFYPENTIEAYKAACDANMAIELDVRQTRDNEIICFHDRYTKRLLNVPGKVSMFSIKTIKKYTVLDSGIRVPTFKEALDTIDNRVQVLVEVKGKLNDEYLRRLLDIQEAYKGELMFHTKNPYNYFILKKHFKLSFGNEKKVFYVLNIFRKRFNFIKGRDYNSQIQKYNELASDMDVQIPSIEDISSIIVRSIETLEDKKEILASIGEVINKYESRVKLAGNSHWVYNSLWLHRGILSNEYMEHSKESFEACVKFAKEQNVLVTIEFDVMLYKGEVRCYHHDRISNLFGQEQSCAAKVKLESSLRLSEVLEIVKDAPNVNLAIDIKDYHIRNRVLEDLIILEIKKSGFKSNFILMSYNPFVLSYFKAIEPCWLRAQIGHSLKGLRKVPFFKFPWVLNGILGILFDMSCADCVLFDDSKWIYYLIAYHKNIRGKPVLIYAPKTFIETEAFIGKDSVANFIVENVADKSAWPYEYIEQFKVKKKE